MMMQNCLKLLLLGVFLCFVVNADGQCDVHITYDAFIATAEDDQGTGSFVGEFNLHNHKADVDAWLLGYKLNGGEELAGADQVLTSDVYVDPASTEKDITFEWAAPENQPFVKDTGMQVKFVGTKDLSKFNGTVSAVTDVEFNNVKCEMEIEEEVEPAFIEPSTYGVEVDFRPIEIIAKDGSQNQHQQIFRIDLISKSDVSLYLNFMKLKYYFAGGFNDMFATASDYMAICVTSESFVCDDLTFNITKGVQGMDSARYALEIGFKDKSGYLLHNTTGPSTPMFTVVPQTQELAYTQLSFTIAVESKIAYNYLDISNDYSFAETKVLKHLNGTDGAKISYRTTVPNDNIPVYYNDDLIAGVTPEYKKFQMDKKAAENSTAQYNPTSCVRDDMSGQIFCSVQTSYCCVGDTSAPVELTPVPVETPATVEDEQETTETSPAPTTTVEDEQETTETSPAPATTTEKEEETHTTDTTPVTTESLKSTQEEEQHSTSDHSDHSDNKDEESSSSSVSAEDLVLVILVVIVAVLVVAGLFVFISKRRQAHSGHKLQVELRSQASNGEGQSLNQYYEQARAQYK